MKSHQPKQPPIIEMFARHWWQRENARYNLGGLRREHPRPTTHILKRSCDAPKLTTGHSSHGIKAAPKIEMEPDVNCETPPRLQPLPQTSLSPGTGQAARGGIKV